MTDISCACPMVGSRRLFQACRPEPPVRGPTSRGLRLTSQNTAGMDNHLRQIPEELQMDIQRYKKSRLPYLVVTNSLTFSTSSVRPTEIFRPTFRRGHVDSSWAQMRWLKLERGEWYIVCGEFFCTANSCCKAALPYAILLCIAVDVAKMVRNRRVDVVISRARGDLVEISATLMGCL